MTSTKLSPELIAKFLQENPSFFTNHANIFTELQIPHPHSGMAIPLAQRQLLAMREQNQALKEHLSGLIENASGNQRISQLLIQWCANMLAQDDINNIPRQVTQGIMQVFELEDVIMKLWNLDKYMPNKEFINDNAEIEKFTASCTTPVCGHISANKEIAHILPDHTKSIALMPLHIGTPKQSIGLLILGSSDNHRFTADMNVDFLETIATLASAALSRLAPKQQPEIA